jgi:NAD-specific glutamate dehydrogenase
MKTTKPNREGIKPSPRRFKAAVVQAAPVAFDRERTLKKVDALAREAALLSPLTLSLDVADLARNTNWPINPASSLHCIIGAEFGLDALRDSAGTMKLEQHWDRLVVRRTAQDFGDMQIKFAEVAAKALGAPPASTDMASMTPGVREWIGSLGQPAQRARSAYAELNAQGPWTFAKLMLISAELNGLIAAVR